MLAVAVWGILLDCYLLGCSIMWRELGHGVVSMCHTFDFMWVLRCWLVLQAEAKKRISNAMTKLLKTARNRDTKQYFQHPVRPTTFTNPEQAEECVRACVCACVRAFVCARVRVCVCACLTWMVESW